jgi:hypothetical protein
LKNPTRVQTTYIILDYMQVHFDSIADFVEYDAEDSPRKNAFIEAMQLMSQHVRSCCDIFKVLYKDKDNDS